MSYSQTLYFTKENYFNYKLNDLILKKECYGYHFVKIKFSWQETKNYMCVCGGAGLLHVHLCVDFICRIRYICFLSLLCHNTLLIVYWFLATIALNFVVFNFMFKIFRKNYCLTWPYIFCRLIMTSLKVKTLHVCVPMPLFSLYQAQLDSCLCQWTITVCQIVSVIENINAIALSLFLTQNGQ